MAMAGRISVDPPHLSGAATDRTIPRWACLTRFDGCGGHRTLGTVCAPPVVSAVERQRPTSPNDPAVHTSLLRLALGSLIGLVSTKRRRAAARRRRSGCARRCRSRHIVRDLTGTPHRGWLRGTLRGRNRPTLLRCRFIPARHCSDGTDYRQDQENQRRRLFPGKANQPVFLFGTPSLAKFPGRQGLFEHYVVDGVARQAWPPSQFSQHPVLSLGSQGVAPDGFRSVSHSDLPQECRHLPRGELRTTVQLRSAHLQALLHEATPVLVANYPTLTGSGSRTCWRRGVTGQGAAAQPQRLPVLRPDGQFTRIAAHRGRTSTFAHHARPPSPPSHPPPGDWPGRRTIPPAQPAPAMRPGSSREWLQAGQLQSLRWLRMLSSHLPVAT